MHSFDDQESSEPTLQKLLASGEYDDSKIIYVKERRSRWSGFASWFSSFMLGVITTATVVGLAYRHNHASKTYSFASTDAMPSVPFETVTFKADPLYSDRTNDETDFAWDMLLPPGRGYVFVSDAEQRGLAPGEQTAFGEIYSVAMYHQLHCLARIRKMHWLFLDGIVTGEDGMARNMAGRTASAHVQHCFDYLRQSIMCAGDMTLEWPKLDGPSSGAVVDGWDVPHTCKSPSAIKGYMDDFHFNSSFSIDAAG